MTELLVEVLAGDMVELSAEGLIAGQHQVIACQLHGRHVGGAYTRVVEKGEGSMTRVLLDLLHPLLQDDLGTHNQGAPTAKRLCVYVCVCTYVCVCVCV